MPKSIQVYSPGQAITAQATAPVVKSTFVAVSGNRTAGGSIAAATATAAGAVLGVAAHDAKAGELFTAHRAGVVRVVAGGVIGAGAQVEVGAGGKAVTLAAGKAVGHAVTGAASAALAEIALY
ncbi:capsid cement protein [Rhodococcus coprophilus]|uniref:capsid cement protein n=1 Tax=Rhodococcus coprophilus TaxID=38310 RepID=UPI0037BCAF8F